MDRNEFIEYIKSCLGYCRIAEEITKEDFDDFVFNQFKKHYDENIGGDFWWSNGASKGALIFPAYKVVIKIPFTGFGEDDYFCHANENIELENSWDYCEAEVELYDIAKNAKLDCFFAKTVKLGELCHHPIYIQEYVDDILGYSGEKTLSRKGYEEVSTLREEGKNCFNEIWIADAIEYYGKKLVSKLLDFIDDISISDLHDENIGYRDGQPIIFDYSGFYD